MEAAIIELEIVLKTLETNEPINRYEGNDDQADLEATNIRRALSVLRAVNSGAPLPS